MQSSNINISDKLHLSENENIIVSASSASANALNPDLENGQNEKLGYSNVFWQKEQNGILWLDGHSGEFEIFLDEQQRITIMDVHGTKLHPEDVTVLKFKDKDIYPREIEDPNKSQYIAEQMELSDLATSESDLLDDEILTLYGVESTIGNEEVTPASLIVHR